MASIESLIAFVREHPRLLVLTGAGISTASGIPDYRDQDGQWKRPRPVLHQDFLRSEAVRRRYWARSMLGWPVIERARPSAAHRALAALEQAGCVARLVTQNVDGLHQRAGSVQVIDLHGRIDRVVCVDCGHGLTRAALQAVLERDNPRMRDYAAAAAPDGDADLEDLASDQFRVPSCDCGGRLKPDVVFFGDHVPRPVVEEAIDALDRADALLVVGSSLMVYSGYRFCLRATQRGLPIAAVNLGCTRADSLLQLKVERSCDEVLAQLAQALAPSPAPALD